MNPFFHLLAAAYIFSTFNIQLKNLPPEIHIENNYASFVQNGDTIVKTYIKPERTIVDRETKEDNAYLLANCMVVLRDVHALGPFCHVPSVGQVEVYTANNDTLIYTQSFKENGIVGTNYTSNFLSGGRTSPKGDWGVITAEAEGRIYGFTILTDEGIAKDFLLPQDVDMDFEAENPVRFNEDNQYTMLLSEYPNKKMTLTINKSGSFQITENK
jgi:hypothetical protein